MTKKDLITLRDNTDDAEIKKALRFAVLRIDALEDRLREVHTLCKSIQRVVRDDE